MCRGGGVYKTQKLQGYTSSGGNGSSGGAPVAAEKVPASNYVSNINTEKCVGANAPSDLPLWPLPC